MNVRDVPVTEDEDFCWPPKENANDVPPIGARNQDACLEIN